MSKIDNLKERRTKLDIEIKRIEQKTKTVERKKRDRRLILWGIVVEKAIESGQISKEKWQGFCGIHLLSERDLVAATELLEDS